MPLLLIFIGIPILEIFLFLQVGGLIGTWPTIAIVIATAVVGTMLLRSQGQQAMLNLRQSVSRLEDPTGPIAHGAMILTSGLLLLTPGFFTDFIGFLLLIPGVRTGILNRIRERIVVMSATQAPHQSARDTVIDGDFVDVTTKQEQSNEDRPPSGWTRH